MDTHYKCAPVLDLTGFRNLSGLNQFSSGAHLQWVPTYTSIWMQFGWSQT